MVGAGAEAGAGTGGFGGGGFGCGGFAGAGAGAAVAALGAAAGFFRIVVEIRRRGDGRAAPQLRGALLLRQAAKLRIEIERVLLQIVEHVKDARPLVDAVEDVSADLDAVEMLLGGEVVEWVEIGVETLPIASRTSVGPNTGSTR